MEYDRIIKSEIERQYEKGYYVDRVKSADLSFGHQRKSALHTVRPEWEIKVFDAFGVRLEPRIELDKIVAPYKKRLHSDQFPLE
jgi:hypothetical protein